MIRPRRLKKTGGMAGDGTKWVGKQYLEGIKDGYKLATHDV